MPAPRTQRLTYAAGEVANAIATRHRLTTMHIGFLFNHDQLHQVAHSLPVAAALTRRRR